MIEIRRIYGGILRTETVWMNSLIKKEFLMKLAKDAVGYWCEDILKGQYQGQGVTAAILDTGIIRHPDFGSRIVEFKDMVNKKKEIYDDSGHGTHVAGILGGSGKMSGGIYAGIAPKVQFVIVKVLDKAGNGNVSMVLEGIEWILELAKTQKIQVVNISVGTHPGLEQGEEQKLLKGVEMLWDTGMTVVVSAENYGPQKGSVAVPGSSRKVITVGAVDLLGWQAGGKRKKWDYSGRGPTEDCVIKPDLAAPGIEITSCSADYTNQWRLPYTVKSGTSMATPIVSGAVACLLSKYPDMTNVEVKLRLRESCIPYEQENYGWGILNMERLMAEIHAMD